MVHVYSIKFPFCIVLGAPPPILIISSDLFLWFIDTSGWNIVKSLNIPLVEVPSYSVGAGMGPDTSSQFYCYKYISFFLSNFYRRVVSASILASLGSVLVYSFAATMLFVLLSGILNVFSLHDFYFCVPIILLRFNEMIEGWVWPWQYIPKDVAKLFLLVFSFINYDRVVWVNFIKMVFYIIY